MITNNALDAYKSAKRVLKNADGFNHDTAIIYGFCMGMLHKEVSYKEQDYIMKALFKYGRRA